MCNMLILTELALITFWYRLGLNVYTYDMSLISIRSREVVIIGGNQITVIVSVLKGTA